MKTPVLNAHKVCYFENFIIISMSPSVLYFGSTTDTYSLTHSLTLTHSLILTYSPSHIVGTISFHSHP